ncbi:piggybac transposable element-derived protein 4 [Holotrichia oblita]|uniref:Piggybac transposable element-derived protein 4 n=1 Tax=Holotrichia oblita TaxID=644536 RepID=A0ACB9TB89_HOLOL|nr:piggybac transposable element-derived protein 4 [Holotrichia oblita]
MVFTAEQNAFILMVHFRSATHNPDGSWTYSLESCIAQFNEAFPDANIPYDVFVQHKRRVLDRFETKNCICTGKSTGRPSPLTQPAVDDIQQRIEDSPKKSLRKLSAQTGFDDASTDEDFSSSDSVNDPEYVPPNSVSELDLSSPTAFVENIDVGQCATPVVHSPSGIAETMPSDSDSSENEDTVQNLHEQATDGEWSVPLGRQQQFDFAAISGLNEAVLLELVNGTPYDFYCSLIDNKIIDNIVDQTNLYATQCLTSEADIPKTPRWHKWQPSDNTKIRRFIGLIGYMDLVKIYMGLVKMPSIENYWSSSLLYRNDVATNTMSRNRFQLLLQALHFDDNEMCPPNDRLHKIQRLVDMCVTNFQQMYTPNKIFCIDESMVPFQGRLIMKQYIPQKIHKYEIKIFKLCCETGYTWNLAIYSGKGEKRQVSLATDIVLKLSAPLLDAGRTRITDNFYTSLELANTLLQRKTHLLGTLRKHRRGNPKEVVTKKLRRGEMISRENQKGITVTKWRDKREVLTLSTCHTEETTELIRRIGPVLKHKAVVDYNFGKASIDLSDQLASYGTALRRSLKWYRKNKIEICD